MAREPNPHFVCRHWHDRQTQRGFSLIKALQESKMSKSDAILRGNEEKKNQRFDGNGAGTSNSVKFMILCSITINLLSK